MTATSPRIARIRIVTCVAAVLAAAMFDGGTRARTVRVEPQRDIELFRTVVTKVAGGSSYYNAMGSELRERRYPTTSVFNWRTPLLYRALAVVPPAAARAALIGAAIALWLLTMLVVRGRSTLAAAITLFIQFGAVVSVTAVPAIFLTEAWSGAIVGLSFCAYRLRRWQTGFGLGVLALFVRELAAPYVVVSAVIAARRKRWSELVAWGVAGLVYFVFFAGHVLAVRSLHQPGDLSQAAPWLSWGGPAFVMQTLRTNAWLLVAPHWLPAAAVLFVLILLACCSSQSPERLRALALVYVIGFLAVGQPFNTYWGLMTAPLWAFAAGDGVEAFQTWLRVAFVRATPSARTDARFAVQGVQSGRHAYD